MSINAYAAGRQFWDAIPDGDDFRLRFMDGLEIVVSWASSGPEVKDTFQNVVTADRVMHPQFQYVCGKTVKQVLTDGKALVLQFTDGHELRSDFTRAPAVRAVDAKVKLTAASAIAIASL
jgi:hypothetical protein